MKTVEFKDKKFLDLLPLNNRDKFICIWDTDSFDCCDEDIRKLINKGCFAFISVGKRAEELHDIFDEILVIINVTENSNRHEIFVDTLWETNPVNDFSEVIHQAKNCMIEEVDRVCNNIYIFTKSSMQQLAEN